MKPNRVAVVFNVVKSLLALPMGDSRQLTRSSSASDIEDLLVLNASGCVCDSRAACVVWTCCWEPHDKFDIDWRLGPWTDHVQTSQLPSHSNAEDRPANCERPLPPRDDLLIIPSRLHGNNIQSDSHQNSVLEYPQMPSFEAFRSVLPQPHTDSGQSRGNGQASLADELPLCGNSPNTGASTHV